jgi:putative heme iron utilization protein
LQQDDEKIEMQPTAHFEPAKVTKSLLRRSRQGALATLMPGSGDPYCSLVNVASAPDGAPLLLLSSLAIHTRNILADGRVSLMLDERAAGDPLEGARIMLSGRAEQAEGDVLKILRPRYLNAHPSAEGFVDFKDFSFFRLRPSGTHLVAGFGRIVDLAPERFLTDVSDAGSLLQAEQEAVAHMNEDHRDAMNLYATRLLGGESTDWRCTGLDPEGIDMQAGATVLRLDFSERVTTPAGLRKMLVSLAEAASAKV